MRPRTLAIVDGEHYPPVVRDALAALPYDFVAAVLVGGTEKLRPGPRGGEDYGVPLLADVAEALGQYEPELVYDLSDEPVLGPAARLRLASRVLAAGVPYAGPDFRLEPPELLPIDLPSIAIVGTGKRVGKTAVTGHVARVVAMDRRVVVVSMGRGGPPEPELVVEPPTLERLLARSRAGGHAASDYLETAALSGVPTVGCRRCGGGLAGAVATSNVLEGIDLAARAEPELLVLDASGASVPPVAADRRILVARDGADATSYLNAYRVLISDIVVLVGGGGGDAIRELKDVPVVRVELRLRPGRPLDGCRAAIFTTGQAPVEHLDCDVALVSRNLADRPALRADLERADADVFLVELKAAAIDVVAEAAAERGADVVLLENEIVPVDGEPDLDALIRSMADSVCPVEVAP